MQIKEVKIDVGEIMLKLARLQSDVDYIKAKLSLEEEMEAWEQISTEDSTNFFEEQDL